MSFKEYSKNYYSTVCHISEFDPKEFRLDVSLGVPNKLEKLSRLAGQPKPDEVVTAKMNAAFFSMSGNGGDTYSTFVDEGLYYHGSCNYYPTLVFWKDGLKLAIEHNPTQSRCAYYQAHAHFAIGAAWTLVVDGKVNYTYNRATLTKAFGHPYQLAPRTMIGQKADGTIVMVVTDGRRTGSRGLTIVNESAIMMDLGCVIAVNMDGGGSSEKIVNGRIVNKLEGGYERSIGTAFMVYGKKSATVTPTPSMITPSVVANSKGYVNASSLNVRTGPSTRYQKLTSIPKGSVVNIKGKNAANTWLYVQLPNMSYGWVYSKYITVVGSTSTVSLKMYRTTTANLRMRRGRGTTFAIICTIPKGTKVEVSKLSNGWFEVKYNGNTGFCYAKYLK